MKLIIYSLLSLLLAGVVSASSLERVVANQNSYSNGDLIELTIYASPTNINFTVDFSRIDSNYDPRGVEIEDLGTNVYKVWYPITFSNTFSDGTYNVVIVGNHPSGSISITYAVKLDNTQLNASSDSELMRISINPTINLSVSNGLVRVCRGNSCDVLTEAEFEASKTLVIGAGTVRLANITYSNLKDEITAGVQSKVNDDMKAYIAEIVDQKRLLDDRIYDLRVANNASLTLVDNSTRRTEAMYKRAFWTNVAAVIATLLIISSGFYIFYLRTQTTWLH